MVGDKIMATTAQVRTPVHLWVVGILALLWNCFGAYDYTMSHMRNMDYLGKMGDANAMLAYMDCDADVRQVRLGSRSSGEPWLDRCCCWCAAAMRCTPLSRR